MIIKYKSIIIDAGQSGQLKTCPTSGAEADQAGHLSCGGSINSAAGTAETGQKRGTAMA
jgi:hypothetical protein